MNIRDHVRTVLTQIVALLVAFTGCVQDGGQKGNEPARKQALTGAFRNTECSYLFMPRDLPAIWPASGNESYNSYEHTGDGRQLRRWNYGRTKCCLVSVGQESSIMETPPGTFLNAANQSVLRCEDLGRGILLFPNGTQEQMPAFVLDDDGKYLCTGGTYYDSQAELRKEVPITIRSLEAPEKVLATCRMKGILSRAFCYQDRLFVWARQFPEGRGAGWMNYEVFRRQGNDLVLEESKKVDPPMVLSSWVVIEDMCPNQQHALLLVKRDLPLTSHRFLLDLKKNKLSDLGPATTQDYAGFLDPHIFDRLLENPASRPSEKR